MWNGRWNVGYDGGLIEEQAEEREFDGLVHSDRADEVAAQDLVLSLAFDMTYSS